MVTWLGWLDKQTGFSVSTAQNYMDGAKLKAKFPKIANLKLRATALYYLAEIHFSAAENKGYDPEIEAKVREAAFAEAKKRWLNLEAIYEIEERFAPEPEKYEPESTAFESFTAPIAVDEETTRDVLEELGGIAIEFQGDNVKCSIPSDRVQQAQETLAAEVESAALIDGPPPELTHDEAIDSDYKKAVETLDRLATKPTERWTDLLPVETIQRVADMLRVIIERARAKRGGQEAA
jgi:hypothetical protein